MMSAIGVLSRILHIATISITTVQVAVDVFVFRSVYSTLLDALRTGMMDPHGVLTPMEVLIFEKHYNKVYEKALTFIMKTLMKSAVIIKPIVATAAIGITALAVDGFQWQHLIPGVGTYLQVRDFVSYSRVLRADMASLGIDVPIAPDSMGPIDLFRYARGTANVVVNTYEQVARQRRN